MQAHEQVVFAEGQGGTGIGRVDVQSGPGTGITITLQLPADARVDRRPVRRQAMQLGQNPAPGWLR